MDRRLLFPALLLLLGCGFGRAEATVRTVTSLSDSGSGTLRNTVAAAAANDVILFNVAGTITLTTGEIAITKNLTIDGPAAGITVSGNGVSRAFNITNASTVAMSKINVVSGQVIGTSFAADNSGGGIMNHGTLSMTDCSLTGNQAVSSNSGSSAGGAIFNYHGTVNLTRCNLSNNSASGQTVYVGGEGGAIYNFQGSTILTDCSVNGNLASRGSVSGGGLGGDGGAVAVGGGTVTAKGCTFAMNSATLVGGAVVNINSPSTFSATNCTFNGNSGNSAPSIFSNGPLTLVSCTISGNSDTGSGGGGGLYTFQAPARIFNTIIAGNSASVGPDVYSSGNLISLGHNLIGKTDGSSGWGASDLTGTAASPLDPQLGPLQNNGGLTLTMALSNTSPALQAGDDAVLSSPYSLTTDQRGSGFPRRQGTHVDIGAYEGDVAQSGTSFTVTTTDDHDDGLCGIVDCSLREAVNASNNTSGTQTVKFASKVTGTIALLNGALNLTDSVTVQGPGASVLAIDTGQRSQIFRITNSSLTVSISKLTLKRGYIFGPGNGTGGGIYNAGTLTLTSCVLSSSSAYGGNGSSGNPGYSGLGGGVYNAGTLTVSSCTFNGNQSFGGGGGYGGGGVGTGNPGGAGGTALGGAIYNSGLLTLKNSTFYGNFAGGGIGGSGTPDGTGGIAAGAGVYNQGTLSADSCTFAANNATGGQFGGAAYGGGIYQAGTASALNTILTGGTAATAGPDAYGNFTSQGFNFVGKGDGATGLVNGTSGNQVGSIASPLNANLGALQDNGGGIPTLLPAPTSPVIDKGKTSFTVDERNQHRPYDNPAIANATGGNGCDIGAVERQAPSFSIADVKMTEGDSGTQNATFTVTLLDPPASTASVQYATADGTAKAPADYTAKTATTLSFSGGANTKTFTIPIVGDTLDEVDETFTVKLSSPVNAAIGDNSATCTILDNDAPPVLAVNDVQVSEGDSGSLGGFFTVTLTPASGKTVTVNYATANGTATAPADYSAISSTTLTFAPGETSKLVPFIHKGDILNEADETFFLNLSSASNATIVDAQGVCTILDNDPLPVLTINDKTVTEGNSGTVSATFTVTLSPASGQTVTVQYATAPGTATAGVDYSVLAPGTLTFSPGQTSKTITVSVKGDTLDETNESFFVNLTNATNALLDDSQGLGKIADDDATPSLSINNVSKTEGNSGTSPVTFTITLSAASGLPVTVQYATANGSAIAPGDYIAVPATAVTFAPGQTSKTFTVAIVGDSVHENTESFNVNLSSPTNATISDSVGTCTITDNDAAASERFAASEAAPTVEANVSAQTVDVSFPGLVPEGIELEINGFPVTPGTATRDRSGVTYFLAKDSLAAGDEVTVTWSEGEAKGVAR